MSPILEAFAGGDFLQWSVTFGIFSNTSLNLPSSYMIFVFLENPIYVKLEKNALCLDVKWSSVLDLDNIRRFSLYRKVT